MPYYSAEYSTRHIPTRVGPNCRDLAIGNWNVSSLTGKEQELVCEAQLYRLDIVGISLTKRRGSGTVELNGGWKIFYSGVDAATSAQAGVGLLVSPNVAECVVDRVPLGERVCLLKLRLQERSLCILQVYAPNIESQYEAFLEEVEVALGKATSSESLVLFGRIYCTCGHRQCNLERCYWATWSPRH